MTQPETKAISTFNMAALATNKSLRSFKFMSFEFTTRRHAGK